MATLPLVNLTRNTKIYKRRREECRDGDFRKLYRFDRHNVEWMASHFLGESFETRGGALSPFMKMQIFLRYVSDPGFQVGVAEDVGCDQSTVCKTVNEVRLFAYPLHPEILKMHVKTKVRQKIMEKADTWIHFPSTLAEVNEAKDLWLKRFRMPCCVGALDCTHVRITKPSVHGDEYINRKNFPSINVQATCDAQERFTSIDATWPGSVHDSRIFKTSSLYRQLQANSAASTTFVLADSGYGAAPWVLVPYQAPSTPAQTYFNSIYAKERVIIERCFGQLKRRFPALHYKLRVHLSRVPEMIISCCVLHNVSKHLNDAEDFPELPEDEKLELGSERAETEATVRRKGQMLRDQIANILFQTRNSNS